MSQRPNGFVDRVDAGRQLAASLRQYAGRPDVIVVALPRGGVPVAAPVARALGAPLDVLVVRKIGVPGNDEFAMGAIALGGVCVLDESLIRRLQLSQQEVNSVIDSERRELLRRENAYRGDRLPPDLFGKVVIVVDDGLATGATMAAAVSAVRAGNPAQVIVAVPVASPSAVQSLSAVVDDVVSLITPTQFRAVGQWYTDFSATSDDEVRQLLAEGFEDADK